MTSYRESVAQRHRFWLGALPFPGPLQSTLDPETQVAQQIATLGWIMIGGSVLIFLVVMGLTGYAVFARHRRTMARSSVVIIGGIAFPLIALSALLIYALVTAGSIVENAAPDHLRVEVVGRQFWWEVRYLDESRHLDTVAANEVHFPVGRPVMLYLTAADVIHSFWVPNLAGKVDMIPGRTNTLRIRIDQPGVWRGQCAEYCGAQHAKMAFHVIAHTPDDFSAWLASQRASAAQPTDKFRERGQRLFLSKECGQEDCCSDCHTVRGTSADGDHGPDLTHVGSRQWIAAGTLPNNPGTLAGWIASSQHLKPGSHMPSFDRYSGEDLRALADYLEHLK